MDLNRLRAQLNISGVKDRDPALYQVIDQLIKFAKELEASILANLANVSSSGGGGGLGYITGKYLTHDNETPTLPNSKQFLAGANIAFDDSVAGIRTISAVGAGGGTLGGEWSVLTDGDEIEPELIFADGDVIMTHTL